MFKNYKIFLKIENIEENNIINDAEINEDNLIKKEDSFDRLYKLQKLIKKESALKEICK